MQNLKRVQENTDKGDKRDSSIASKHSTSNKFLKRKPDGKRIISGAGGAKRRENQISEYFESQIFSNHRNNNVNLQDCKSEGNKFISNSIEADGIRREMGRDPLKKLQKVKSQKNIHLIHREFETQSLGDREKDKNLKSKVTQNKVFNDKNSNRDDFQPEQTCLKGNLTFQQRLTTKKSKTQFFDQEELSLLKEDTIKTEDVYELSISQAQNNEEDTTKKKNPVKTDLQSLVKRSKLLQHKIDQCLEREYLLKTEQKHLEEMIKQKDKIIDKLNKEKTLLNKKCKGQSDLQAEKLQDLLQQLKNQLEKEMQRQLNLKQQNTFLQNELIAKNQELIMVYDKYSELEYNCNQERKKMKQVIQHMKIQIEKYKAQSRQYMSQDSFVQMQKWKQKLIQQQQQLKYLKIHNQCLLISKEELHKSENEVKKLKQERDYFKRKVLDHVKRSNSKLSEISSTGGSVLLELSQISIDQ